MICLVGESRIYGVNTSCWPWYSFHPKAPKLHCRDVHRALAVARAAQIPDLMQSDGSRLRTAAQEII